MARSQIDQIRAKTNSQPYEAIDDDGNSSRIGASPFFFPLRHVAESIPGGVETMVTLASLSRDNRVRAVAGRWTSLSRKAKQSIEFEQLCRVVGIDGGHFFSAITATAFELGMDVGFNRQPPMLDRPGPHVPPAGSERQGDARAVFQRRGFLG
jgi:hypothetical protein